MLKGKIEIQSRIPLNNLNRGEGGERDEEIEEEILDLIYTPGVAYVAKEISNNKELAYKYTSKWNNVAIVCDGSRILGLGNIGPEGAIPVMEGKSVLFKTLGGINASPLCISTQDKEQIISLVKAVEPMFGAINVEDIQSPKVLEIVERLQNELPIPIFHDDQHGTAVVTLAALLNAIKLVGNKKELGNIKVVIAGAGSSGYGIFKILHKIGCNNIIVIDSKGSLYKGRIEGIDNQYKKEIADKTNSNKLSGNLEQIIKDADVFIGVSGKGGLLTANMIRSMNNDPIIFALSNPDPEILPSDALNAGARIVSTGRSDYPNQINNALVFPYMLRALLDIRIKSIREDMLIAVSYAIAGLIKQDQLKEDYIIPKLNDPRLHFAITQAIKNIHIQNLNE